ncbi:MAG TPA: glycosyltransferase family 4 protein [Pirellulales bacterium]|nr:glycosyltransferase family 4 protein [Pirellulales bacterium]
MRIVYLAAGAAGMYCGTCLHDNTLAAALAANGDDVLLVPTYTPIRTDEDDVSRRRVMFGGINVYLQQLSPWFRFLPAPISAVLDSPALLGGLSKLNFSINPAKLGALTVSVLRGEEGRQRKELAKLVDWLAREVKPDVVHLSNAMLAGMARQIRGRLDVPVLCSLTGEDIFLEKLRPPYREQARDVLRERARDVARFVALNRYYAGYMAEYMALDAERIDVIPHGLNLAGHGTRTSAAGPRPLVIGYLARICHDKGLHQLVEAFTLLKLDQSLPSVKLRVAGYLGAADRKYLQGIVESIRAAGHENDFEYVGEVDRPGKIAFLQSLDVMCLPTVYRESKGLSVLEALANAVPVVLPAHGTFPELIEDTGGGVVFPPGDTSALAESLKQLLLDAPRAAELGRRGQQSIQARYTAQRMAELTRTLYHRVLSESRASVAEKA